MESVTYGVQKPSGTGFEKRPAERNSGSASYKAGKMAQGTSPAYAGKGSDRTKNPKSSANAGTQTKGSGGQKRGK